MSKENKAFDAVVIALGVAVLIPSLILLNGFTYQQLWNWFLVPLNAPSLSLPHAIGISCIIAALKNIREKGDGETAWRLWDGVAQCVLVLAIGYIAKQWM